MHTQRLTLSRTRIDACSQTEAQYDYNITTCMWYVCAHGNRTTNSRIVHLAVLCHTCSTCLSCCFFLRALTYKYKNEWRLWRELETTSIWLTITSLQASNSSEARAEGHSHTGMRSLARSWKSFTAKGQGHHRKSPVSRIQRRPCLRLTVFTYLHRCTCQLHNGTYIFIIPNGAHPKFSKGSANLIFFSISSPWG